MGQSSQMIAFNLASHERMKPLTVSSPCSLRASSHIFSSLPSLAPARLTQFHCLDLLAPSLETKLAHGSARSIVLGYGNVTPKIRLLNLASHGPQPRLAISVSHCRGFVMQSFRPRTSFVVLSLPKRHRSSLVLPRRLGQNVPPTLHPSRAFWVLLVILPPLALGLATWKLDVKFVLFLRVQIVLFALFFSYV